MIKILCGIPVITGADHCRKAFDSVLNQENIELLIIDNNAEPEVKALIKEYSDRYNVHITVNPKNIYVNPSWNQIMNYFSWYSDAQYLVIMNSDLVMQNDWSNICREWWANQPDHLLLPIITDELPTKIHMVEQIGNQVDSGTPGVFITLNRDQVKLVNPIPREIKIWFGDNVIFDTLRRLKYVTVIPECLLASHTWSSTISRVPEAYEIIEQDKIAWELIKHKVYG
jgi:glycosyltransferase involved in cell wall biosynthesis